MVPMVALAAWSHNLAFSVGDGYILVRDIIDGYYGPVCPASFSAC